ncbi:sugar ABC transporter substrate-binding protein [Clostridium sp. D53t1_180928_C8]|uniref:ABC transporter substrate-binding protein n=1 Tax=Clostridium sp. D53t1_180928_C8 TaxID=2787101 RepID=UPI0018A9C5CF|nr:sugar ABC transporter substrate-binding protein [Clostridium sp. D53t1_180928_C8]
MSIKKFLAGLLTASLMITLTSCSGGSTTGKEGKTKSEDTEVSTDISNSSGKLVVAIWDKNQLDGIQEIVNDFTDKTGIEVDIQVTPWEQYWTMLEAGATGGSLPDVFWMHSNEISRYTEYEMLLDLTDKIKSSNMIDLTKYPEDIVQIYNYQDKQFAIPKDIDTIALWYNKTMFDEAGVEYPNENWTWDDFKEACGKLTKDDGSQFGYAIKPTNNQAGWYNTVYSMGGRIISDDKKESKMNDPKTVQALEFITGIIKDGHTPAYEVVTENDDTALFEAGKVAMITQGSWMLAELCNNDYVKANCDIAVLPKDTITGNRVSIYNGLGWAASANTSYPDEAWQLIEYLGSKEAQQKQSDLGVVISAYEGTTENWVKAYPNFNLKAYLDMMDNLVIRPYSKTTVTWEEMTSEKLIDAWTGKKEVKDVCNDITTQMNEILSDEQ